MEELEETRMLHETRDRQEYTFVQEMLTLGSCNHRERIEKEHRLKKYLDDFMNSSQMLHTIYKKRLGQRTALEENPFDEFYHQLNQILDKNLDVAIIPSEIDNDDDDNDVQLDAEHKPNQNTNQITNNLDIKKKTKPTPVANGSGVLFTDEESHGKYLDLNQGHLEYCQLMKMDYISFLKNFDNPSKLESTMRSSNAYRKYLETMIDYFRDFSSRAKPLFDYKGAEGITKTEFSNEWSKKRIDLNNVDSWEELSSLGLDKLKNELQALGLKCGGTLEDRAKRLFSVRGKRPEEIDQKLKPPSLVAASKKNCSLEPYHIGELESILIMYGDYYNDHRLATIENVQRKQSRTAEERNESDEETSDIEFDNVDDGEAVYNPKNLPLGWDGKPIPYWLYKLHGLNLTFTCEICGNAVYKGPKSFQRHFAEWRHAQGMNALGIPNTAHFANITKIKDAIILWDKLKTEKERNKFQALVEEEFEDSQGNVVNKKTYEDLKRQGLL